MATLEQISIAAGDKIDALHEKLIKELAALGATAQDIESGDLFTFASKCSPAVRKQVEEACKQYHDQVQAVIDKSSAVSYSYAIKNNIDGIAKKLPEALSEQEYWRALTSDTYQNIRVESPYGLSLSDRVWNYTTQAKAEFEAAMSVAIEDGFENGMSAENIGRNIRKYLNNPDAMWRRYHTKVQQADGTKKDVVEWRKREIGPDGKVHFVKKPLDHPGRGVYRSARMNALRCSRTEINMGYREGDHSAWNSVAFVLGIEIEISNNHTSKGVVGIFRDICDDLAGKYPKTFKFNGWHPMCRCHATPLLPTSEQMEEYLKAGSPDGFFDKYEIKDTPPQFKKWVKGNANNIQAAAKGEKSMPYFLRDNAKQTNEILGEEIINEPTTKAAKVSIETAQAKVEQKNTNAEIHYGNNILRIMEGVKDADTTALKAAINSGDTNAIMEEAKKLRAIGKEITRLKNLSEPLKLAKNISIPDLKKANNEIEKKVKSLSKSAANLEEYDGIKKMYDGLSSYINKLKAMEEGPVKNAMIESVEKLIEIEDKKLQWSSNKIVLKHFQKFNFNSKKYKDLIKEAEEAIAKKDINAYNNTHQKLWKEKEKELAKLKASKTPAQTTIKKSVENNTGAENLPTYSEERKKKALYCKSTKQSMQELLPIADKTYGNMSEEQKKAIFSYTKSSGRYNRPLRGYDRSWSNYKGVGKVSLNNEIADGEQRIKLIDKAIDASQYDKDIWVRRGIETEDGVFSFLGINDINDLNNNLIGKIVQDHAYISTAASSNTGFKGFNLKIFCPKGTKMLYIDGRSAYVSENEMLLKRGTKFRILKVKGPNIELEVVAQ